MGHTRPLTQHLKYLELVSCREAHDKGGIQDAARCCIHGSLDEVGELVAGPGWTSDSLGQECIIRLGEALINRLRPFQVIEMLFGNGVPYRPREGGNIVVATKEDYLLARRHHEDHKRLLDVTDPVRLRSTTEHFELVEEIKVILLNKYSITTHHISAASSPERVRHWLDRCGDTSAGSATIFLAR